MEWSWEECSWKGPYLTSWIRVTAMKYRFVGGRGSRRIAETGISVWSVVEVSVKWEKVERGNYLGVVHYRKCREENSNHLVPRLRGSPRVRACTHLEVSNIISHNVGRQSRQGHVLLLRRAGRTWLGLNKEEIGQKRSHDQFRSPFEKKTQRMSASMVLCGGWSSKIQVAKAVPKFDQIAAQSYCLTRLCQFTTEGSRPLPTADPSVEKLGSQIVEGSQMVEYHRSIGSSRRESLGSLPLTALINGGMIIEVVRTYLAVSVWLPWQKISNDRFIQSPEKDPVVEVWLCTLPVFNIIVRLNFQIWKLKVRDLGERYLSKLGNYRGHILPYIVVATLISQRDCWRMIRVRSEPSTVSRQTSSHKRATTWLNLNCLSASINS